MATIQPVVLSDLTTASIGGAGVFDVLMRSHKAHLEQEFKLGRIKGPEYATVYLGSLQEVLKSAITFLLQKDKAALEAELIRAQVSLAEVQAAKVQAEIALVNQQTANAMAEHAVLVAQECKLRAEYDVLMASLQKTLEERELLKWKAITEKAQTTSMGVDDNSTIGKQKLLYAAQTEGYKRDAEQKAAKVVVDAWGIQRSTDSTTSTASTNLDNASVGRIVGKLFAGVGA